VCTHLRTSGLEPTFGPRLVRRGSALWMQTSLIEVVEDRSGKSESQNRSIEVGCGPAWLLHLMLHSAPPLRTGNPSLAGFGQIQICWQPTLLTQIRV
jgi:hypothetical protein